jgi:hypothetical protein
LNDKTSPITDKDWDTSGLPLASLDQTLPLILTFSRTVAYSNFDPTPNESDWIQYLQPEDIQALGRSLRRIDPNWTQPNRQHGVERVWYQGHEFYFDLMFELQGETISWFQFTLRGRVLSWKASSNRIETGETEETDTPPVVSYYAASKGIRSGAEVDADLLHLVRQILRSRPDDVLLITMAELLDGAMT